MKKLFFASLSVLLLLVGCGYYNELKAGREFCKANPVTCQDGVDAKATELGTKAGIAVGTLVTGAVAGSPVAPLAPVAGAAAGAGTKLAVSNLLSLLLGAWIGRKHMKAGLKDTK